MGLNDGGVRPPGLRGIDPIEIPGSVIERWPLDEGSGNTAANAESDFDLSVNNAIWSADSGAIGGYVLAFDGVDDIESSNATKSPGDMTMAMTLEFDNNITDNAMPQMYRGTGTASTGGAGLACIRFTGTENEIDFAVRSDDDSYLAVSAQLSTGTKHRVVGIIDTANNELKISNNGTVQDTLDISGYSFQETNENEHYVGGRDDDAEYYEGRVDEPLQDETAWGSEELSDDYNRQPWS